MDCSYSVVFFRVDYIGAVIEFTINKDGKHFIVSDVVVVVACEDTMRYKPTNLSGVDYFVLLPLGKQGRAKDSDKEVDWEYLVEKSPEDTGKLAFGANFYPYLTKPGHNFNVSLYEPESMSGFLSLSDKKVYKSSFNLEEKSRGMPNS